MTTHVLIGFEQVPGAAQCLLGGQGVEFRRDINLVKFGSNCSLTVRGHDTGEFRFNAFYEGYTLDIGKKGGLYADIIIHAAHTFFGVPLGYTLGLFCVAGAPDHIFELVLQCPDGESVSWGPFSGLQDVLTNTMRAQIMLVTGGECRFIPPFDENSKVAR